MIMYINVANKIRHTIPGYATIVWKIDANPKQIGQHLGLLYIFIAHPQIFCHSFGCRIGLALSSVYMLMKILRKY